MKPEDPLGPIGGVLAGIGLGILTWLIAAALIILAWTAQ
jgi:hypothetical protein